MPDDIKEKTKEFVAADFIEGITKVKTSTPEKANQALLYMLDDLQEMMSSVSKSKKEWEDTVDSITDPLFIHDREFKVVRCNRAYKELSGSAKFKELIGRPYFEVFPKMEGPFRSCLKAVEEEKEEEIITMNRFFKVRYYPVRDANGAYLYSVHLMEDITERKMTEARYKTIIKTAMEGFWLMDAKGRVLDVNDAYCQMTGYSRDEMLNMSIFDIETAETPEITAQHIQWIMEKGCDRFESRHRCKDRRIVDIDASVTYIKADEGRFFAFIRDITEKKRAEDKIRQEMNVTRHLLMIAEATARITDIDMFLEQVVSCVNNIMRSDATLSYLFDKDTKTFEPGHATGLPHEEVAFFKAEAIDLAVPFAHRSLECEVMVGSGKDSLKDLLGGALRWLEGINAMSAMPLCGREGCLGLLVCLYRSGAGSGELEKTLMKGISHQVSVALEDAGLYKASTDRMIELSRKIETIKVMHEIDRSILSTLNRSDVLETTARMVARVIHCERCTVMLVDAEKGGFVYEAGFGVEYIKKGALVPFENTDATEILKTKRPQYVSDLAESEGLRLFEEALLKEGFKSHIRVPIIIKGQVVGVLSVGGKRPAAFNTEFLSTLEKMASQTGVALENAKLVEDLKALFLSTLKTLSNAIDAKSPWTRGHSERMTKISIGIGKELGLGPKEIESLEIAGFLHDIGKLGTYEEILNKPGKLTDEEIRLMREHPAKGAEILEPIKQLKDIIPAVKYHQEFYDGNGYPEGLKGEDIPLMARILGVADTIDAMGADRPYRKGKSMDVIVAELKRCSGIQFDPKVVEAFLKTQKL